MFDKSTCNISEVPIFDLFIVLFHILKGDPTFWQYFNVCNCQCKHLFSILFIINLSIEYSKQMKISEILKHLHFEANNCFFINTFFFLLILRSDRYADFDILVALDIAYMLG